MRESSPGSSAWRDLFNSPSPQLLGKKPLSGPDADVGVGCGAGRAVGVGVGVGSDPHAASATLSMAAIAANATVRSKVDLVFIVSWASLPCAWSADYVPMVSGCMILSVSALQSVSDGYTFSKARNS